MCGTYCTCIGVDKVLFLQTALPEVQEQYQGVLKEIKILQQQEHALQEQSLSVRLKVEQIDASICEHNNKIKHWQKEVSEEPGGLDLSGHCCHS